MLLRNSRFVPVIPSRVYKSDMYRGGEMIDKDFLGARLDYKSIGSNE